ncbi:MAG TPA: hypothetical protein VFK01_07975 [Bradyrhizobium sp.]|nr:hypothetical protein [Bradyrhizobium sp.]
MINQISAFLIERGISGQRVESRRLRKAALCLELSFHVGNAPLGICLDRDRWLRRQLKYRCVLTLAEVRDQGDLTIGELERVVMRGRLV